MINLNDLPERRELQEKKKLFDMYEVKGREHFTNYARTLQDVTINKYSKYKFEIWDISYFSGDTQVIAEVKVRNENPDKYDDWLLEKYKYDKLQQLLKAYPRARIHYINIYLDGSIRIWDITDLNKAKWETKYNPTTTCGNNEYKKKEVTFLNVKDTIKVKKKDE